jgi:uncharacterized surface protein with fasciclin (FAS1) repeats
MANIMNENKGMWLGGLALVIVAVLGLWWFSTSQPIVGGVDSMASSTSETGSNGSVTRVDRSSSSVVSIAQSISGASTFGGWLSSSGVAAQLTGKGPYTIFVASDAAVAKLKAGTFTNLSAAGKKRFVEYSIVKGRAIDVDAQVSGTIPALSGDDLNFDNTNNIPMVNSGVVIAQYKGSNGVVYLINTVLVPPVKDPAFEI